MLIKLCYPTGNARVGDNNVICGALLIFDGSTLSEDCWPGIFIYVRVLPRAYMKMEGQQLLSYC